jgi:putative permease
VTPRANDLFDALARTLYLAAALAVLLWLLHQIQVVLLVSLLAVILAVAFNAPVTWMEGRGVNRGLGTALSFLAVAALAGVAGWVVVPRLLEEIPTLVEQVPALVEALMAQVSAAVGDHPEVQRQAQRVLDWLFNLVEGLWQYTGAFLGALVLGIFLLALVLYLVANLRAVLRWYVESMPPRLRDPAARAFARSSKMVLGWVFASVVLGGIKATAAFLFLTLVGVPGAVVWSVLAFFGAFVPRVGFYFMTLPPVLVAFSVDPVTALWTLLFYLVFSEILGNFVAPKIYAETMELNPVFVLFMTLAMGYAFGIVGVLIAAPVAGMLKAYYDEFYLARQPDDLHLERRVDAMMARDASAAGVRSRPEPKA